MTKKIHSRQVAGFTLVELLTVIAIIGILAGILIPVVGKVRKTARVTACMSNMRQVGMAAAMWSTDNKNRIVHAGGVAWTFELAPYLGLTGTEERADVFRCPDDPSESPRQLRTYRYNSGNSSTGEKLATSADRRRSLADVNNPSGYVMLFDVAYTGTLDLPLWKYNTMIWARNYDEQFSPETPGTYPRPHYEGRAVNLLFYDGHVARHAYPLPERFYHWDL
ncbi:N-terminal cleavage protein [Opitutaceae bacterium TAV5]|nr:N-terminal cleavage protein [Opitutaceae bacterium TAV5]